MVKFLSQTTLINCRVSPQTIDKLKRHLSGQGYAMESIKARIQKKLWNCLQWGSGQQSVIFSNGITVFKLDFIGILDISRFLSTFFFFKVN